MPLILPGAARPGNGTTLLAGVRSALDATGDVILEAYLKECQEDFAAGKGDVSELIAAVKLARG
jgi:CsoR family transcriptional regulator, copper-sensing transcriptional repressor